MLNSVNLNDKTYEELLSEAIAQIPLYSKEWTNYNVSDPGITILQNLTAFGLLQQESINNVPDGVKRKLLKLMGYTARENRPATVLVQSPAQGGPILPALYRLWSGTIPFETTETVPLNAWGLAAVYAEENGKYRDLTRILSAGTETAAFPFGRHPAAGNAFTCVLSGTPEVGEPIYLWLQVAQEERRTPFHDEKEIPTFAKVRWQYKTADGWCDARFEDETKGLLRSGAVKLWLEGALPAAQEDTPVSGCALRCFLETADFDTAPRLCSVAAHLFPMVQKCTRVHTFRFDDPSRAVLAREFAEDGMFLVFCAEEEGAPYRLCRAGDYYTEDTAQGAALRFDAQPYAVRVVCFDGEMIHHRLLGPVCGYEKQTVQLDIVRNVVAEDFAIALAVQEGDGGTAYHFVAPGEVGPDGFRYHLRSHSAQLVIDDPGCGGYEMLLTSCAVTEGARGNIRAGTVLEQRGGYDGTEVEARYTCPAPGCGGVSYESAEELRMRFSADMQQTSVAVRTEDYETLVRQTPGLCIHKVKAVAFGSKNLVKIAVKPYTEEDFPKLSDAYMRQIRSFLEPRRMLTTRFEICQPRYVPIGVRATLSIRGMASHAYEEAERLLRDALDHIHGEQEFGECVRFNDLYQKLSALPFVDAVDALNIYPESADAVLTGGDIHPDDDCLCCPGTIELTLREHGR